LAQYGNAKHEHAEKLIIQEMRHGVMAYAIVFNDCEKETKGKKKNFEQNGCSIIVETQHAQYPENNEHYGKDNPELFFNPHEFRHLG